MGRLLQEIVLGRVGGKLFSFGHENYRRFGSERVLNFVLDDLEDSF